MLVADDGGGGGLRAFDGCLSTSIFGSFYLYARSSFPVPAAYEKPERLEMALEWKY